jgi:hypothetical protein
MSTHPVLALWGVYQADGGLIGELTYLAGKLRGTAHCALCDITHGTVAMKREWKLMAGGLSVPFPLVHLNERSADLEAVTRGRTPCVAAETEDGYTIVVDAEALDACAGSIEAFRAALYGGLTEAGLALPTASVA